MHKNYEWHLHTVDGKTLLMQEPLHAVVGRRTIHRKKLELSMRLGVAVTNDRSQRVALRILRMMNEDVYHSFFKTVSDQAGLDT